MNQAPSVAAIEPVTATPTTNAKIIARRAPTVTGTGSAFCPKTAAADQSSASPKPSNTPPSASRSNR